MFMPIPLDKDDWSPCSYLFLFSPENYAASHYSFIWAQVSYGGGGGGGGGERGYQVYIRCLCQSPWIKMTGVLVPISSCSHLRIMLPHITPSSGLR